MAKSNDSGWADLFITAIKLERDSPAGRRNILVFAVSFALAIIIVPVKVAEIVSDAFLIALNHQPPSYVPNWLVVVLVLGALVIGIVCMLFLMHVERRKHK